MFFTPNLAGAPNIASSREREKKSRIQSKVGLDRTDFDRALINVLKAWETLYLWFELLILVFHLK